MSPGKSPDITTPAWGKSKATGEISVGTSPLLRAVPIEQIDEEMPANSHGALRDSYSLTIPDGEGGFLSKDL